MFENSPCISLRKCLEENEDESAVLPLFLDRNRNRISANLSDGIDSGISGIRATVVPSSSLLWEKLRQASIGFVSNEIGYFYIVKLEYIFI